MFKHISPSGKMVIASAVILVPALFFALAMARAPSQASLEIPATEEPQSELQHNLNDGKLIATTICEGCHGDRSETSNTDVPQLNGQHAEYILSSLMAHRNSERADPRMSPIALDLSEADMNNVAAYYASLQPFGVLENGDPKVEIPEVNLSEDPFAKIRKLASRCSGCHGDDGNTSIGAMPSLAGQHMPYLIASLKAYRDGARPGMMKGFVASFDDGQIEDLSYFYASRTPIRQDTLFDGDPYAGVAVARPCAVCHGADGNVDNQDMPRLAGLNAAYLSIAIESYKTGKRKHSSMEDAVSNLRAEDIKNVSAYYAMSEPKPAAVHKPLTISEWAEKCDRCHGLDGNSSDPNVPILAGQSQIYLSNALKNYHLGKNKSSIMYAMTFQMTESDLDKMAAYYASRITTQSKE